jgi:hypothetical protein
MIRPGEIFIYKAHPQTAPSTPFTDQARKDLVKIKAHEIEQAKKRFGR